MVTLPKGKFSDHMLFQAQRNSRKCGELESVGLGSCFSLNTTGYAMLDKWFPGRWRGWTMKLKAHFSSQKTSNLLSVAGAQHYKLKIDYIGIKEITGKGDISSLQ